MKKELILWTLILLTVLAIGAWSQQDDEEEQQAQQAKIIEEKVVLPIQPPKPKPTPIEIQPIEPKAESKQRFAPPSLITPPERESEIEPTGQFWFKQPGLVTPPAFQETDLSPNIRFQPPNIIGAPDYLKEDQPQGVQFQSPGPINPPDYYKQPQSQGFPFQTPSPVNAPDYRNPYNPRGVSSINFKQPSLLANIPPSQPLTDYKKMRFSAPRSVTGASSVYSFATLEDFTGGLNQADFPNKIADNEATEQMNFIWSTSGKLEPRPGFDKYNTTEFDVGKRVWGLYPYYTPDGDKILLAGVNGTLWADTNEAKTLDVSVKTGLQSNNKYYDFETFKGKAIVVHEGDYPFWYDGDSTQNLGGKAYSGKGLLLVEWGTDVEGCRTLFMTGIKEGYWDWRNREPIVEWEDGQWAGYLAKFVDSAGVSYFYTIEDNRVDTLFLRGQNAPSSWWGSIDILSWFEYDTLYCCNVPMTAPTDYCNVTYTMAGQCGDDDDWALGDSCMILKVVSGEQTGAERVVNDVTPNVLNCDFTVNRRFTDSLNINDSLMLFKRGFWKPRLIEVFKNRTFLAGMTHNQNLVVFSRHNNYEDYHPDNFFTVKTGDGDKIIALATFYDDQLGYKDRSRDCLVIFKENSIYKLVWNSATDYYLVQVTENIGCVASQSIVNVEGKYLLFLHTTGVYAFDGRTVTLVSKKIQPIIETIHPSIHYATAGYCDRHYYLSIPVATANNDSALVFNIDFGAWAKVNIKSAFFAQQSGVGDSIKLLFAHPNKTFIYEFGKATIDTGEVIPLTYKSKAFDFNSIADRKRFTYFDLDYNLTSGNFTTYFYTDFGDSLRYNKTVSESGGYRYSRLPLNADCLGRNFSFKITSSSHLELGKVGLKFKKIKE